MEKGSITLHPKHGVNPTIEVCAVCGHDTGNLLLLGMNRGKEAARYTNTGGLFPQCEGVLKVGGVIILEADGAENAPVRTGRMVGLKADAEISIGIKKSKNADPAKGMVCMMRPDEFEKLFGACNFKTPDETAVKN